MFRRCFSNELHLSFNFFLGASFQIFLSKELATSAIVLSAKMSDRKNDAKITRARSGPTCFSHHFLLHACANVLEQQAMKAIWRSQILSRILRKTDYGPIQCMIPLHKLVGSKHRKRQNLLNYQNLDLIKM